MEMYHLPCRGAVLWLVKTKRGSVRHLSFASPDSRIRKSVLHESFSPNISINDKHRVINDSKNDFRLDIR